MTLELKHVVEILQLSPYQISSQQPTGLTGRWLDMQFLSLSSTTLRGAMEVYLQT